MKIRRFSCSNIHGYLSFDLDFGASLTFLTGINGSGKTTAVRAITALLTPSLRDLANLEYGELSVVIDDGHQATIRAKKSVDEIHLSCSGIEEVLAVPILRSDAYEPRARFAERERDFYREQETVNARHPVLMRIDGFPTPMFLDLERRYQIGTRRRYEEPRLYARPTPVNPLGGSLVESLRDAQDLAEVSFRRFLARRTQLTDELKQEIILTAFEPPSASDATIGFTLPSKSLMKQIEKNESVVEESLSQIGISHERIVSVVKPFFARAKEVAERIPSERSLRKGLDEDVLKEIQAWSAIAPKLRQINRLAELISRYNDEVRTAMEPIARYRQSVNQFLSDSAKEILFDGSGNILVGVGGQKKPRAITALSSGERQVVVILTHLAFNPQARRANVLIIDEPELSLHVRWQELFVDAVMTASPGIQLILATHSPSIIGGRLENCVDVEEARRDDRVFA